MYTVVYFKQKFEAIPEEDWCTGAYHNGLASCALGHCGSDMGAPTEEGTALQELFLRTLGTSANAVNDGRSDLHAFPQDTPKERILAALDKIQKILTESEAA